MKTFISFGKKLFLIKPVSISIDRKKKNKWNKRKFQCIIYKYSITVIYWYDELHQMKHIYTGILILVTLEHFYQIWPFFDHFPSYAAIFYLYNVLYVMWLLRYIIYVMIKSTYRVAWLSLCHNELSSVTAERRFYYFWFIFASSTFLPFNFIHFHSTSNNESP